MLSGNNGKTSAKASWWRERVFINALFTWSLFQQDFFKIFLTRGSLTHRYEGHNWTFFCSFFKRCSFMLVNCASSFIIKTQATLSTMWSCCSVVVQWVSGGYDHLILTEAECSSECQCSCWFFVNILMEAESQADLWPLYRGILRSQVSVHNTQPERFSLSDLLSCHNNQHRAFSNMMCGRLSKWDRPLTGGC